MIPREWLEAADRRIRPTVVTTPVTEDPQRGFFLKWENHQVTGSFKIRGALNKVLVLEPWERSQGLVTCSAGNHGQGVALAGKQTQSRVIVFASDHAVPSKILAMQKLGADVRLVKGGYALAEMCARDFATRESMTFISPYNDGQVIAGQGTIGLELIRQIPDLAAIDSMYIPVGGGGLLAGIAESMSELADRPRIIGVQSEASPYFYELFNSGTQVNVIEHESIADGLAGAVEEGSITIPLVRQLADEILLVSENEIMQAVSFAWTAYHEKIEGSAAAALAGALRSGVPAESKIVVISGGNIQPEEFKRLCESGKQDDPL